MHNNEYPPNSKQNNYSSTSVYKPALGSLHDRGLSEWHLRSIAPCWPFTPAILYLAELGIKSGCWVGTAVIGTQRDAMFVPVPGIEAPVVAATVGKANNDLALSNCGRTICRGNIVGANAGTGMPLPPPPPTFKMGTWLLGFLTVDVGVDQSRFFIFVLERMIPAEAASLYCSSDNNISAGCRGTVYWGWTCGGRASLMGALLAVPERAMGPQ